VLSLRSQRLSGEFMADFRNMWAFPLVPM
jgi:hypothetical protein